MINYSVSTQLRRTQRVLALTLTAGLDFERGLVL